MAPHQEKNLDCLKTGLDKAVDSINKLGDKIENGINGDKIDKALCHFEDPTFMQLLDFDKDCDRMIDIDFGDWHTSFDAIWLWVVILLLLLWCVCSCLACCCGEYEEVTRRPSRRPCGRLYYDPEDFEMRRLR